jgi:hypothetical protein
MLAHRLQVLSTTLASLSVFHYDLIYVCIISSFGKGFTPRPRDTQLYLGETEALGVEGGLGTSGFEEWWVDYLRSK